MLETDNFLALDSKQALEPILQNKHVNIQRGVCSTTSAHSHRIIQD
jgi:hypothetical protein